ncbi:MAG: response regulator [Chromatiales bacterium]|nr:response regulator [Chromatiales bacterium]
MEQAGNILCVDDDDLSLTLLATIIQKAGSYTVTKARSGRDCLELIGQHPFDLIILDFHLGDMNGFEVCREIPGSSLNPDVKVIISSVADQDDIRRKNESSHVVKVVQKPYTPDQLIADLDTVLSI